MFGVLARRVVLLPRYGDVVVDGQVLDHLAEPDAACVRADRNAKLFRHEHDRDGLVHPGETASVNLAELDAAGLEELLEDDSVLAMFAGGHFDAKRGKLLQITRALTSVKSSTLGIL